MAGPAIQLLPHFQIASRPANVTGIAEPADNDDEPIRILQLTDMHLFPDGATSWKCTPKGLVQGRLVDFAAERFPTPHSNSLAARLVSDLVADARPHLVVFTGDIVDARPWGASNPALKNGKPAAANVSNGDSFLQFEEAFMSVVRSLSYVTSYVSGQSWLPEKKSMIPSWSTITLNDDAFQPPTSHHQLVMHRESNNPQTPSFNGQARLYGMCQ